MRTKAIKERINLLITQYEEDIKLDEAKLKILKQERRSMAKEGIVIDIKMINKQITEVATQIEDYYKYIEELRETLNMMDHLTIF